MASAPPDIGGPAGEAAPPPDAPAPAVIGSGGNGGVGELAAEFWATEPESSELEQPTRQTTATATTSRGKKAQRPTLRIPRPLPIRPSHAQRTAKTPPADINPNAVIMPKISPTFQAIWDYFGKILAVLCLAGITWDAARPVARTTSATDCYRRSGKVTRVRPFSWRSPVKKGTATADPHIARRDSVPGACGSVPRRGCPGT